MVTTLVAGGLLGALSWEELVVKLTQKWPNNQEVRIVCHGHSVPAGYFVTPAVDPFNSYPHLFHQALARRYPTAVINVIVTAIGGENSLQGAKRFESDVLSLKPDLVTLDYALNDRGLDMKAVKEAWKSMVVSAQQKGILVVLMTPTPDMREDILDGSSALAQHAKQVRDLAEETGAKLVDSYKKFYELKSSGRDLEGYMSQVNHPNRAGHEIVAAELERLFGGGT